MRQVRFTRRAADDVVRELTYSESSWGATQQRRLRRTLKAVWEKIAASPERGRPLGAGRYRVLIRKMNLVVLYRWDGGKDEDPRIAALLSAKRDLSPSRIDTFFEGRADGAERRA